MVDHKVHPAVVAKEWKKHLTAQKVAAMSVGISPEHVPLQAEDIIISFSFMDYGMKDKNPLDFVQFYNKTNPNGTPPTLQNDTMDVHSSSQWRQCLAAERVHS
jgi:deoxynucleoside triphosphate triphosphohydrolase SAMHD1